MIRRIRPPMILDGQLDTLNGEPYILDCRNVDITWTIGIVVFTRGRCPEWVWPIFTVNEWAQSRATGLG